LGEAVDLRGKISDGGLPCGSFLGLSMITRRSIADLRQRALSETLFDSREIAAIP
jgi:hypothetical protein